MGAVVVDFVVLIVKCKFRILSLPTGQKYEKLL